jgi:ribosomal protein S18 acetylase RimI-like enzyme
MLNIKSIFSNEDFEKLSISRNQFIDFLFKYLDAFGDPKTDIEKCLDYAFSNNPGMGGFALAAFDDDEFIGALIMNKTGMSGYIPDNILVYVAVHPKTRGKGIGRQIVDKSIEIADGDVKLHVEYDNPAKRLYERVGFTNKYAEMRFIKK